VHIVFLSDQVAGFDQHLVTIRFVNPYRGLSFVQRAFGHLILL